MTKEVLVTIEGRQLGTEEEPIIETASGTYHFTNGRHYIQYDEKLMDSAVVSKNTIKISSSHIVLSKKTNQISQMEFDLNEITQTIYPTAYGNLFFDITTSSITLTEEPEKITVTMAYNLTTEGSQVSDNSICITVTSVK